MNETEPDSLPGKRERRGEVVLAGVVVVWTVVFIYLSAELPKWGVPSVGLISAFPPLSGNGTLLVRIVFL